jgi:4'-phosphopantetheinyl transferase
MEPSGLIRLFFAAPFAADDVSGLEAASRLLGADEAERAGRFVFDRDRMRFIAGHALVRRALSRCLDVDPADWRFAANAHGRPEVSLPEAGRQFRFSASRTDGMVMCAIAAGREIGADIEKLRPYPAGVVKRYFAGREAAAIAQKDEPERSAEFFKLWTLKEAYCKAKGVGLAIPTDKLSFDVSGNPPALAILPPLEDDSAAWAFRTLSPPGGYLVALCAEIRNQPEVSMTIERF